MWSFYIPSMLAVCFGVWWMMRYYAAPGVQPWVKVVTGVAWWTAISIIALVPIDVWTTLQRTPDIQALGVLWSISYWSTQVLTWVLIPWTNNYLDAGQFTFFGRLKWAITAQATFFLIVGALAAVGLVLLLTVGHMSVGELPSFVMMIINTYGLVAVTFLLGFGLVEIPRIMWRKSEPEKRFRWHCHRVGIAADKLKAAVAEVGVVVTVVEATSQPMPKRDPLRPYMDLIYGLAEEQAPVKPSAVARGSNGRVNLDDLTDADLDYGADVEGLARLRRRLHHALSAYYVERSEYVMMVARALELDNVCRARASRDYTPRTPLGAPVLHPSAWAVWRMRYKCVVRPWVLKLAGLVLAGGSLLVVWSEATIGSGRSPDLSPFSLAIHAARHGEVATQVLVMLPLAYMCAACHFSLFKLGMFKFYHLMAHSTQPASLLLNAGQVARFAAPLCYNFLHVIRMHEYLAHGEATVFTKKMASAMSDVPFFGHDFNTWFPLLMVIYTTLVALNVWGVMVRIVMPARFRFDEEHASDEHTQRGQELLRLEVEAQGRGLEVTDCLGLWDCESGKGGASGGSHSGKGRGSQAEMTARLKPDSPPVVRRTSRSNILASSSTASAAAATTAVRGYQPPAGLSPLTRSLVRNKYASSSTESLPAAAAGSGGGGGGARRAPSSSGGLDDIFARMSPGSGGEEGSSGRIDEEEALAGGLLGSAHQDSAPTSGFHLGWKRGRR